MKVKKGVVITGIICITIMQMFALSQGINGTLFTLCVAAIAAAIGVVIPLERVIK